MGNDKNEKKIKSAEKAKERSLKKNPKQWQEDI